MICHSCPSRAEQLGRVYLHNVVCPNLGEQCSCYFAFALLPLLEKELFYAYNIIRRKIMFPVLNKNYALLKQYKSSIVYPLLGENSSAVMSGVYSYERTNETGAEILELCNGALSIEDIAKKLAEKHSCSVTESFPLVSKFVEEACRKGYLSTQEDKKVSAINVSGSFDVIFPFNAQIEITKKCPLKCRHCFNNSGTAKRKEMSTSELFTVIDKLAAMGVKKVMLTGGEPTVRADFIEIIQYASKKFMAVSVATNGYFITPDLIYKISKLKNIVIQVSLDGTEEHHNFIRGVDNSFSKAVNAIQEMSNAHMNVVVASTFNNYNMEDMEYLTALAKKLGAKQITYSITNQIGRAKDNPDLFGFSVEAMLSNAKRLQKEYTDQTFYIHVNDSARDAECATSTCGRGCTQICIRENGDVSPCLQFNLAYGNLITQDINDIFHHSRICHFMNIPETDYEICKNCKKVLECGGCIALAWDTPLEECSWKQQNIGLYNSINSLKI